MAQPQECISPTCRTASGRFMLPIYATVKYTIPLHIFFHYTRIWKKISVGGLYTSLFCAIIPALFPYFLPFWYPCILLHFQMFFITCIIYGLALLMVCSWALAVDLTSLQTILNVKFHPDWRLCGALARHYARYRCTEGQMTPLLNLFLHVNIRCQVASFPGLPRFFCSSVSTFFATLPNPCIIVNGNRRTEKTG